MFFMPTMAGCRVAYNWTRTWLTGAKTTPTIYAIDIHIPHQINNLDVIFDSELFFAAWRAVNEKTDITEFGK